MRRLGTAALAIVLAFGGLTGCAPAKTATPEPTYSCTPDAKRAGGTCTKADHDEQAADQALFEEAEKVYREFTAERTRLYQAGGTTEPTPEMRRLATEKTLSEAVALLKKAREQGLRTEGEVKLVSIRRMSETRGDSVVGLRACEDGRGVTNFDASGTPSGSGRPVNTQIWLKRLDGRLVIFDWEGKAAAECAD